MRLLATLMGTLVAALVMAPLHADDAKPFWSTPTIEGYGKIHYLPDAAYQPDADKTYKIVFSLSKAGKTPADVSPALDHVARAVNLYVASGVPLERLKIVAVAHGPATALALDDEHYRQKFGVDNPNLKLISELREAGVDVSVCAQAVAEQGFEYAWVADQVTVALSALTTVTTLQSQGYVLMQM